MRYFSLKRYCMKMLSRFDLAKAFKARGSRCFAGIMIVLLPCYSAAKTVSVSVTFGNPQSNGGECVGKGVCRASLDMEVQNVIPAKGAIDKSISVSDGVKVDFVVNEVNPTTLMMRFSKKELLKKQPGQLAAFADPSGYSFDSIYALDKGICASLALPAGSVVPANKPFTVQITEDLVTVYIPVSR